MAIQDLISLDSTGVHYADYPTLLEAFKAEYRAIYGADVILDADSQDGQWIAVTALALFETLQIAASVYSSQSPSTAQSDALTRNVRINGISRDAATASTVNLLVTGTTGTVLTNAVASDASGTRWLITSPSTITNGAGTTVTAVSEEIGAVSASANTITNISTPTQGWASVTNPAAASLGLPVESDADLRNRQRVSTMIPSLSVFEGIVAAVKAVPGVGEVTGYENDTTAVDLDGVPGHSIAIVVQNNSDAAAIAGAIAKKKTSGTGTFAAAPATVISQPVVDKYGEVNVINYGVAAQALILVEVEIQKIGNYDTNTDAVIKQAISDYISAIPIGGDVYISRLYTPANQDGTSWGSTYHVISVKASRSPAAPGTADIAILYNEFTTCAPANVTLTPVP